MPRSAWWYAFDILYLLPNYFFKMASSVLGPPHLALLWTGQNFSNTPGLLLTGCFLSVCETVLLYCQNFSLLLFFKWSIWPSLDNCLTHSFRKCACWAGAIIPVLKILSQLLKSKGLYGHQQQQARSPPSSLLWTRNMWRRKIHNFCFLF